MGKIILNNISNSLEETEHLAIEFSKKISIGNKTIFNGELGVGKTEFVRAICNSLEVSEIVTSPSFTIINQYEGILNTNEITIFHIDLYRIKSKTEIINLGFQELLETPNSIFFIEWAENSFGMLNNYDYKITILPNLDIENSRIINIEKI